MMLFRNTCLISFSFVFALSFSFLNRIPLRVLDKNAVDYRLSNIMSTTVLKEYDAQAITVLEGLDPVRKRPGMYIGNTGYRGLHHLIFEVVDNSVDEALAGHCTEVNITLHRDGSVEVQDNGRGIPCSLHPTTGKSALETVLCVLHAGGKFGGDDSGYKVSGGLHGVGVSVVNALSETLHVKVNRDSKSYSMSFKRGHATADLQYRPSTTKDIRGTMITFYPDPQIFKTTLDFDFDRIASRLDELAYLNAGLTLRLTDRRDLASRVTSSSTSSRSTTSNNNVEEEFSAAPLVDSTNIPVTTSRHTPDDSVDAAPPRIVTYHHEGGIRELVKVLCADKIPLHPEVDIISVIEERKGVVVDVALRWSKDLYSDSLTGFANGIRTADGGSHLDGMKAAIARTVNTFARKNNKLKDTDSNIPGEFLREGLIAVINVKVPEPEFEGQTKTRLGNPEVRQIVDAVVSECLTTCFEWNPTILTAIVIKSMEAMSASAAARAAREMVRKKSLLVSSVLPGKLSDCASRHPSESEIYIVEGESAAGSAKQGRDRANQAILPLSGKILNIEKTSTSKIYQNKELQALISAIGLGVRGQDFDVQTLRYHKIVIMTDADVDGAHIRLLLLTFFYRYQKELIEKGFIYIACPPLYKVTTKGKEGKEKYLYDQGAMDTYLATLPSSASVQIQRFKGLGEMMPQQLWDTTMDPAKRTLKKVSVEDAVSCDKLFSVLMGDNVAFRKEFIITNSENLKLGDLDF